MRPIVWYRHHGPALLPEKSMQLHFGAWTGITFRYGYRELRIGLYIPRRASRREHG